MENLVNRGAPRDFLRIHRLCISGASHPEACWSNWTNKNAAGTTPGQYPGETLEKTQQCAKAQVAFHLFRIERNFPLPPEQAAEPEAVREARNIRNWFKSEFLQQDPAPENQEHTPNPSNPYQFWEGLDLTVMPDGGENLIPNPTQPDVLDYIEAFCRQLDYGIGSVETLVALTKKPETLPAILQEENSLPQDSPACQSLRFLLGLPEVNPGPPNPWEPEPRWMKQDRMEDRSPDYSLGWENSPQTGMTPPVTQEQFFRNVEQSLGRKPRTIVANTSWSEWEKSQKP